MDSRFLFVLLLLPGLAQAVICKTVGADGVTSFTNVPAAECPQGSQVLDYGRPQQHTERADVFTPGITGREVSFAGYESIEIVSPEDDGTVRSNEGRVTVRVELEPVLQANHYVTAHVDGKAHKGRYGSSEILLKGVDRGTHRLYTTVTDSKGKTLIKSKTITFTLHRTHPQSAITVDPITGDNYVDTDDPSTVRITGTSDVGPVILRFPGSGKVFGPSLERVTGDEVAKWEILVPRSVLAREASFYAESQGGRFSAISTHSVAPELFSAAFQSPDDPANYDPSAPADYTPRDGGISTTPGTNPAFKPSYGTQ